LFVQNLRRKPNRRDGKRERDDSRSSSSDVNSDFGTDDDYRYGAFHDFHHHVTKGPFTLARECERGKYHCTDDLLFYWFRISFMPTDNFCFYLQNRLIQTSQTGGQRYNDTSPFSIPWVEPSPHHLTVKGSVQPWLLSPDLHYKTFYRSNCCHIIISWSVCHFHPSLKFASKANSLPLEWSTVISSTLEGSCLA